LRALTEFGDGVQRIITSSPSLGLLPPQQRPEDGSGSDEELAQPTIFPFVIRHHGRVLRLDDCRKIYRALARDARMDVSADARGRDQEIGAQLCLIGQPVALGESAALRICAGARLVTECWSSDEDIARENLRRELGCVGTVVAKIEWLLANIDGLSAMEVSRGA
jgi:hypothetical protein